MTIRDILGAALRAALAGCTHHQLARSTVLATGTVMDIQYRTVLNNLALLSCHPEALPSHIDLADGVVQVSDEGAFGTGGGFTTAGTPFGLDQFGPSGSRKVSEQWGTDAITDPRRLTGLQDLYRTALGLPPLPPPNTVAYLRLGEAERRKGSNGGKGDSGRSLSRAAAETSSGKEGSTSSSGGGSAGGDGEPSVPIDLLLSDVTPPGWFHLGSKRDVPKDACYVGRYGDRYAWVTPDGMAGLARFTVTVLGAVKLTPGRSSLRSRGLAFTR
jgi:hypothetical protein